MNKMAYGWNGISKRKHWLLGEKQVKLFVSMPKKININNPIHTTQLAN